MESKTSTAPVMSKMKVHVRVKPMGEGKSDNKPPGSLISYAKKRLLKVDAEANHIVFGEKDTEGNKTEMKFVDNVCDD